MLYLWMLVSVLGWIGAAVLLSRRRGSLSLMNRLGRLFFAGSTVVVVGMWSLVPVVYASRVSDLQVTAIIPRWYDQVIDFGVPNAMLCTAASGAWGATGAGLFLRFKIYTLLGFNWYYMAAVLPWNLSLKMRERAWTPARPYRVGSSDLGPLVVINGASILLFLLIYAAILYIEKSLRAHTLPRVNSAPGAG